jgi:hypothetical protein
MGHSVARIFSPEPYTATGIWLKSRFFSPVAASLAAVCSGVSSANLRLHRRAHRAMEFNPSAHINAHKSAAKIITMLVSKLASFMNESCVLLPYDGGMLSSMSRNRRCILQFFQINKMGRFNFMESLKLCVEPVRILKGFETVELALIFFFFFWSE